MGWPVKRIHNTHGKSNLYSLPSETVRKIRTVEPEKVSEKPVQFPKNEVSEKSVQGVRKTRTQLSEKSVHKRKNHKRITKLLDNCEYWWYIVR